jgi:uncharacterized OB-fold protein
MFSNLQCQTPSATLETGKRGKAIAKVCPDCGAGISAAKTRCAPCSDIRWDERRVVNAKARYARRKTAACSV